MRITIHRGIDKIGGCITEIATENSRILIDLGQNLPDGNDTVDDSLANKASIKNLTKDVNAIFYTHYHGDHIGLFHLVPDSVQQYLGETAKEVMLCKHKQLSHIPSREKQSKLEISVIESMKTFRKAHEVVINDISITPYFVSHSACDAYMFLIEADGTRILHTGDFRGHGYLSKGLLPTLEKYVLKKGDIDFLITEGTMLSRIDEEVKSEGDLRKEAIELMKNYKFVFVLSSSTDMEKLASFYSANRAMKNRPFVCDYFQKSILDIFTNSAGKISPLFIFENAVPFSERNNKLIEWMKQRGFCMLMRPTDKFINYLNFLNSIINLEESILIYSMWSEYINPQSIHANKRYLDFTNRFPRTIKLHTSGHATADRLTEVCELINPTTGIIPIHSEKSSNLKKLPISHNIKEKIITATTRKENVEIIIGSK